MSGYLLDSDVAIELMRGRNLPVVKKLSSTSRQHVFLSTVTISELLFGAYRSRDPELSMRLCREFWSSFRIVPLDTAAAEEAGRIRADLKGKGQRIGAYNLLIAGIALANEQILVTHNTREFQRIPALPLEDWTEPFVATEIVALPAPV